MGRDVIKIIIYVQVLNKQNTSTASKPSKLEFYFKQDPIRFATFILSGPSGLQFIIINQN